jgi:hypothetical protein
MSNLFRRQGLRNSPWSLSMTSRQRLHLRAPTHSAIDCSRMCRFPAQRRTHDVRPISIQARRSLARRRTSGSTREREILRTRANSYLLLDQPTSTYRTAITAFSFMVSGIASAITAHDMATCSARGKRRGDAQVRSPLAKLHP